MKFSVAVIFVFTKCSVLLAAFTNRWELPEGRIVGGHDAVPHSHPYLVSLQTRFLWARMHMCGGTLLNENWILTAGHCITESWLIRWLPLDAVVGAHNVDNYGQKAQVSTISERIPHPLYEGGIGPHDIAMLRTSAPFTFTKEVQPARLPINYNLSPQDFTLTGWGVLKTTMFIPDLPSILQEVTVTNVPYEDCYQALEKIKDDNEENPLNKDANICTGPITGGVAACNGDSGGPLVQFTTKDIGDYNDRVEQVNQENYDYNGENDFNKNTIDGDEQNDHKEQAPVVLGIVSWGVTPCGEKGAPTVYTKVSRYIDFINLYIKT